MKRRLGLIGAAVIGLGMSAGEAGAQTCIAAPLKTCEWRSATPRIDRYQVPSGGDVVCSAYSGAPDELQYDRYSYVGYKLYLTSCFQSCTWAQTNDTQAYDTFCN